MSNENIEVPSVGVPIEIRRLTDYELKQIVEGLLIPGQGSAKSMAQELIERREDEAHRKD